jgi:ABC-type Fe3+-hydroxamate transport system substrate-binding protein
LASWIDAIGTAHGRAGNPRIVSLVPSLTELICDLGLERFLVGRTGFCVHPARVVKAIPKVGGTKTVKVERVRSLAPTHLIVNIDENEKHTVEALKKFVPNIIVTHPVQPHDNMALYQLIGGIFGAEAEAERLCRAFQTSYNELVGACRTLTRQSVLYLIWKDPWMTISRDTYISRTLAAANWDTVPEVTAERYPKLSLDADILARAQRVMLSTEPYAFSARHVGELRDVHPNVSLIDAEMVSWYGSRAIAGLAYLRDLRLAAR